MKTAYFSLGCFWSPQLEFEKIKGVKKADMCGNGLCSLIKAHG